MRVLKYFIPLFVILITSCNSQNKLPPDVLPDEVIPTRQQLEYHQMEMVGFIHFTINTFTNREWGYGDEDPQLFYPSQLDVEQWVRTAQAGGLNELILTAKHHDGFCLWPS